MASDGMKDGAGGGAGSTYPFRQILSTPRASDMKAGGHGDTGRMGSARHQLQNAMLGTPTANPAPRGSVLRRQKGRMTTDQDDFDRTPNMGEVVHFLMPETLPTPTKRDKRMDAVLDGAQTGRAPDKWAYARQIAAMLTEAGLTGPSATLPTTYGWMMGYPPGWLGRALMSAMAKGSLRPASSSKRSATRSSRKSPKP